MTDSCARKRHSDAIRVLHLPTTVGGNPQGVSRHLKALGIKSESWALVDTPFDYKPDKVLFNVSDSMLARELKRLLAARYLFRGLDVVHFNYGASLFSPPVFSSDSASMLKRALRWLFSIYMLSMQRFEFYVLQLRGIPAFVHYQGDDARQGDYCVTNFEITFATEVGAQYYTEAGDELKRAQIRLFGRFCKKIYSLNPDLLHVLPKSAQFVPYSHVALNEWEPSYTQLENRPLRIGHAPSNRGVKGTKYIIEAAQRLREAGYQFELILIEGLSNADAKRKYQEIDVLVDQLFCGWYGGVAVEAMALGKPVLVYIRDSDMKFIPAEMVKDFPFIRVTPTSIEDGLRHVLEMPRKELLKLAQKSRKFVQVWHNPEEIASRIRSDYEHALSRTSLRRC